VEPISDIMPPAIPLWENALKAVDTNTHRLVQHLNMHLLRGYQFPDPHIFLPEGRRTAYITGWLTCRAGWVQSLISNSAELPVPNTQQWRSFLFDKSLSFNPATTPPHPVPQPTKKGKSNNRKEKLEASIKEIFTIRLQSVAVPSELFWHEKKVIDGQVNLLTPTTTAEILWDLFEHNFRLELLALDRCVMASSWQDPTVAAIRDALVRDVFPGDGFLVGTMPTSDHGLAADQWEDRLPFVEKLRKLMLDWLGELARKLKAIRALDSVDFVPTRSDVEKVERIVASFYCQTFFDFSGRAPITPHRIPAWSPSMAASSSSTL
jgi:hypothetical protein